MPNLFVACFFILILHCSTVFADEPESNIHSIEFTGARLIPADANSFESLTIPLKRAGNLILVDALVDSLEGNLIFDSGSSRVLLNAVYFRQKKKANMQRSGGITGAVTSVGKAEVNKLWISDLEYSELPADVADLGHIEQSRNAKVLGLFGFSLFDGFEVVLDLENSLLELHYLDRNGNRTGNSSPKSFGLELPLTRHSDVLFVEARMAGRRGLYCIDTGAETNVLSNDLPSKMLNSLTVLRRIQLRGTAKQGTEALLCVMNDFSMMKHDLSGMKALITNLRHMKNAYGIEIDGMLGCDFLEKGVFHFNLVTNKLGINFAE
jgi:hypothetical protein